MESTHSCRKLPSLPQQPRQQSSQFQIHLWRQTYTHSCIFHLCGDFHRYSPALHCNPNHLNWPPDPNLNPIPTSALNPRLHLQTVLWRRGPTKTVPLCKNVLIFTVEWVLIQYIQGHTHNPTHTHRNTHTHTLRLKEMQHRAERDVMCHSARGRALPRLGAKIPPCCTVLGHVAALRSMLSQLVHRVTDCAYRKKEMIVPPSQCSCLVIYRPLKLPHLSQSALVNSVLL